MPHYRQQLPKRPIEHEEFVQVVQALTSPTKGVNFVDNWALEQGILLARLHGDKSARIIS